MNTRIPLLILIAAAPAYGMRFVASPTPLVTGAAAAPFAAAVGRDLTRLELSAAPSLSAPFLGASPLDMEIAGRIAALSARPTPEGAAIAVPRRLEIYRHSFEEIGRAAREGDRGAAAVPFLESLPGRSVEEKLDRLFRTDDMGRVRAISDAIERTARQTTLAADAFLKVFDPESEAPMAAEEEAQSRALLARFEYIGDEAVAKRLADAVLTRKSRSANLNLAKGFERAGGVWERRQWLLETMTGARQARVGRFVDALSGPGAAASAKERGIVSLAEARARYGRRERSRVPSPEESGRVLAFPAADSPAAPERVHTRDIDLALAWTENYLEKAERPSLDPASLNRMLLTIRRYANAEHARGGWFPVERFAALAEKAVSEVEKGGASVPERRSDVIFIADHLAETARLLSASDDALYAPDRAMALHDGLEREMLRAEETGRRLSSGHRVPAFATGALMTLAAFLWQTPLPAVAAAAAAVAALAWWIAALRRYAAFQRSVTAPLRDAVWRD